MTKKGFTLIELLIVVAISALMSALAITFSSVGKNQIALSVESSKMAQLLLQAKELSIATYTNGGAGLSCGYGMHIDYAAKQYSLFTFSPSTGARCPSIASTTMYTAAQMVDAEKEYQNQSWQIPLNEGLVYSTPIPADAVSDVLFYPPSPTTLILRNGDTHFMSPVQTSKVYLETIDGSASTSVSINAAGQVDL